MTDSEDDRVHSIATEPKVGIGQRCILLQTPHGNVLWDCIALLDSSTIERVQALGELKAIVISHPHYYTTHLAWGEAFGCPVYIAADDEEWCCRSDQSGVRRLIKEPTQEILPGVMAAKPGGHFPGSLVLCWEKKLFIADTLVTTPVSTVNAVRVNFNDTGIHSLHTTISTALQALQAMRSCGVFRIW